MGFSRQEYWSGLPFPSPGDLPKPRCPTLQADSLPSEPWGKPQWTPWIVYKREAGYMQQCGWISKPHLSCWMKEVIHQRIYMKYKKTWKLIYSDRNQNSHCLGDKETNNWKEAWGNFLGWEKYSICWLEWWLHTIVKTHHIVHFAFVHFIGYRLNLNQQKKKKKGSSRV